MDIETARDKDGVRKADDAAFGADAGSRHEIDATQELNYGAVCTAIADSGLQGFVAHEFLPTRDPMKSLRQAVQICDV